MIYTPYISPLETMKKLLLLLALLVSYTSWCQQKYDPQILYDHPGGLYDHDSLRNLHITFYNNNYDSILNANWEANNGLRLPARVKLDQQTFENVAIRYKGNSTYAIPNDLNNPKLPLNLDMNDLVPGQKLLGYKKVKLANSMFDPTFVREVSAYNIYRRYLPSPEANLMKVHVQGDYLGLYVNTEAVNRQFLKKHFFENDGVLFKCDPIQQYGQPGPTGNSNLKWLGPDSTDYYNHYTIKSKRGWAELMHLIDVINNNPEQIDSVLNVDRVLWAFAVNTALPNLDSYNGLFQHNYYLYQTGDGLFQMIPWDLSESYIGSQLVANSNPNNLYEYSPFAGYNCWSMPLIEKLTHDSTAHYAQIYAAHIRTILEESLISSRIKGHTDELQLLAYGAAEADMNKMFDMTAYTSNVTSLLTLPFFKVAGITSTVDLRRDYLESHHEISKTPPKILTVDLIDVGGMKYVTAEVQHVNDVELMTTISHYSSKFRPTEMKDDGTNGDQVANDGIYTALLPDQNTGPDVKYYVRALNSDAIQLSPQRAEYEFYTFTSGLTANTPTIDQDNVARIYPNPATSMVSVELFNHGTVDCQLYSMQGELLLSRKTNHSQLTLDLSELSSGVYFLKINGRSHKIVKAGIK